MTRAELAGYLVNLNTLIDAIEDVGLHKPSWLVDEYNRAWTQFKECVQDEARKSEQQRQLTETGTGVTGGQSGRSSAAGTGAG